MTTSITFVLSHAIPSACGWLRTFFRWPWFALKLLTARTCYFLTRRLPYEIVDPLGFPIDSDRVLISYWAMIIERKIRNVRWSRPFATMKNPVAIDVGANAGVFSHLLRIVNPSSVIHAYEPLPDMTERLKGIVLTQDGESSVVSAAVGSIEGTATLFASRPDDTHASLVASNEKQNALEVPVVTLDASLPDCNIALLKIDTEHFEIEVLKGAHDTLRRCQFLILEIHLEQELAEIVQLLGPGWKETRITEADFLFVRHH